MHKHTVAFAIVLAAACAAGCRSQAPRSVEYQTLAQDPNRDTETARRENGRALALIEQGQLEEAEKALKAALAADIFFGPAHNNLAVVYQKREQYYLAAWEFQYAAKLMPYSPEPRANLGLVYEAVGRTAEAESWFDKALALQPDNPTLLGNLARSLLRQGRRDERTRALLADLALKTTDPEWAKWARDQLALMPQPEAPASVGPGASPALVPSVPSVPLPLPAQPPEKPAQP